MRKLTLVGRYKNALVNGEGTALHGNSKLGIFAGLSMGHFVRGKYKRAGIRRFNYVDDVRYFDGCYLLFETTGP